jgi:cyclic-di-AMP phosphodiesterase PgpH
MIAKKIKNKTKEIIKSNEVKDDARGFFSKYFSFRSKYAQRLYIFLLTLAAIIAIISYNFTPDIGIELGRPSPRTIKANRAISFEDPERTEEERNRNEAEVGDIYRYDINVLTGDEGALYNIRYFYLLTRVVQKNEARTFEEKVDYLINLFGNEYPEPVIAAALNMPLETNSFLMNRTQNIARDIMKENIRPNELDFAKNEAVKIVDASEEISDEHKLVVSNVLQRNIRPTAVFDPIATQNARIEAREKTPPYMVTISQGQTIVTEGEIVNESDIMVLTRLGLLNMGFNWSRFLYIFFINLISLFLLGFYIYKFDKKTYRNSKKLVIASIIIFLFIAIIKLFTVLGSLHLNLWNYLFPVIAASMLASIIFNTRMGIMMTLVICINLGIASEFDFSLAIIYLLGGTFASFLVSNVSQRLSIMRAGFFSSLLLAFLFFTSNLIGGDIGTIILYTILGVVNGVICAIITIGLLPFIESTFNIVTAMGLLELSHTDQRLLKELLISAPGTYNHSLLVGHLAESSAKAIGANALLVKVAALYHDLGKMKRPEYFYENQLNIENVHDKLNPSMSRNIIANHIKDGVEIALKNKIPKRVAEIISQHHGNSVITYFFKKQQGLDSLAIPANIDNSLEGHFRYPSKKPQSKEAAILMLADSTEAAVRSIDKMTPKKIEQMVSDIIKTKLEDGQLDEADITLMEINIIKSKLIDGLISIYHSRISYPDLSLKVASE